MIKRTCTGLTCTFDATDSTDPDDGISEWAWEFGDGGTSEESVVEHTYDVAGSYTATLTVTDDTGDTDDATQTFAVGTAPPPPAPISFVGQATRNANSTAFPVQVPATSRSVTPCSCSPRRWHDAPHRARRGLDPGGRVVDGEVTTVWRKVATASEPAAPCG